MESIKKKKTTFGDRLNIFQISGSLTTHLLPGLFLTKSLFIKYILIRFRRYVQLILIWKKVII